MRAERGGVCFELDYPCSCVSTPPTPQTHTVCDADKTCTSFVMSPPTKLDQNNQTCRLYDVTWGNTLTYGGVAGNDTAGFNSTGSTIYLKRSKPVGLFGASEYLCIAIYQRGERVEQEGPHTCVCMCVGRTHVCRMDP